MTLCKPGLEELSFAVDNLVAQLTEKTRQYESTETPDPQTYSSPEDSSLRRTVLFENEVLVFGGMSRESVIDAMSNLGIPTDAYEITTNGPPLFFESNPATTDITPAPAYYLQHGDLPYGFAGTTEAPGTFQFSSPELTKLTFAPAPQMVDDAYAVYGSNLPSYVTYDYVKNSLAKDDRFRVLMYGLGWTPSNTPTQATSDVNQGRYGNVGFRVGELSEKRFFTDKDPFLQMIADLGNASADTLDSGFLGGVGDSNYSIGQYIGWRWRLQKKETPQDLIYAPLLDMPKGQLDTFQVNPSPQQPYRGAEGVYPVVLVEMLRDVNLWF